MAVAFVREPRDCSECGDPIPTSRLDAGHGRTLTRSRRCSAIREERVQQEYVDAGRDRQTPSAYQTRAKVGGPRPLSGPKAHPYLRLTREAEALLATGASVAGVATMLCRRWGWKFARVIVFALRERGTLPS